MKTSKNKKKKKNLLIFIGAIVFVYLFFLSEQIATTERVTHLQSTIRDTRNESSDVTFTYQGKHYLVTQQADVILEETNEVITNVYTKEKVLSLSLFYLISKNDPLFYSPRIDLNGWKKILEKLENARVDFLLATEKYSKKPPKITKAADEAYEFMFNNPESLFPFSFLKNLLISVELQEDFFRNPSKETALALIRAQQATQNAYSESVRKRLQLTEIATQNAHITNFLYLGSATNFNIVKEDFNLFVKNADALDREILTRKMCLQRGECENVLRKPERKTMPTSFFHDTRPAISRDNQVPLEVITPPNTETTSGPYLISSKCWGSIKNESQQQWPMYLFIGSYKDVDVALPMRADEQFYFDVRESNTIMDKKKAELGITLNDQAATNVYMCNDQQFYVNTMILYQLQKLIEEEGVITETENKLVSSSFPNDEILESLVNEYEPTISGPKWERSIIAQNKLLGFELILGKLYEFIEVYTTITRINKNSYRDSLLGARSSYSLLYLPFAQSVWRLQETPNYLLPNTYAIPVKYRIWSKLIEDKNFDPNKNKIWDTKLNEEIYAGIKEEAKKEVNLNPFDKMIQKVIESYIRYPLNNPL